MNTSRYLNIKCFFRIILLLLFFSGCGKKQKNVFDFTKKKVVAKVFKFELGFVKGVQVKKTDQGNLITWNVLDVSPKYEKYFVGYNVYRLVRSSIIPKKSLNNKPIIKNELLDGEVLSLSDEFKLKSYCYVVRPVFLIDEKIIFGAISQIVCID